MKKKKNVSDNEATSTDVKKASIERKSTNKRKTKKDKKDKKPQSEAQLVEFDWGLIVNNLKQNKGITLHNCEDMEGSKSSIKPDQHIKSDNKNEKEGEESARRVFIEYVQTKEDLEIATSAILSPLQEFVGLEQFKKKMRGIISLKYMNEIRIRKKLPIFLSNNNFVFFGKTGTGKTSVSQIIGSIFFNARISSTDKIVYTTTSEFISAGSRSNFFYNAVNGTLIIDDFVSVEYDDLYYRRDYDSFVRHLLYCLKEYQGKVNVILCGNNEGISKFFKTYPFLSTYFPENIEFEELNLDQAIELYFRKCDQYNYIVSIEAHKKLISVLSESMTKSYHIYRGGNGIQNLFEMTLRRQANRLSYKAPSQLNDSALLTIEPDDIP